MREAIHQFKYNNFRVLANPLAGLLEKNLRTSPVTFELIVPVPLHPRRQKIRGVNQTALLARDLGLRLGQRVLEDGLVRVRDTKPQFDLNLEQRSKNVEGAFGWCGQQSVAGSSVLLVDDVYTTGATLESCAKVLKQAGASSVVALVLAQDR